MNQQTKLGERLQMLKAARKFARQSEADAWLRIPTASHEIGQQDREAYAECMRALRCIQREVDRTRAQFLDTFYQ